ncbi:ABC transporter A family member [Hibiscus syriacus]|uniref:ABC transporter A family member n=1 Tax=Hibiscus syriacus TaxID=106335 RepID=A0A6A3A1A6_HIBSY|nr:ABC transporter A family member [Hibiscus syriacus]
MGSTTVASAALLVALNLLFFTLVSSTYVQCPPPPHKSPSLPPRDQCTLSSGARQGPNAALSFRVWPISMPPFAFAPLSRPKSWGSTSMFPFHCPCCSIPVERQCPPVTNALIKLISTPFSPMFWVTYS